MKKKLLVLLTAIVASLCLAVGLSACSDKTTTEPTHEHTYASAWTYDETHHWHNATCEHSSEISSRAIHQFTGNTCDICGYEKEESGTTDPVDNKKTVTYDLNGAEGSLLPAQFKVGAAMSTLPTPTRDGYTFKWWVDAENNKYTSATLMPDRDVTLTAVWEEINYKTVSFNIEEVSNKTIKDMSFVVGELMTSLPDPSVGGYRFIAWEDKDGIRYTAASVMPNEDIILFGVFEKIVTSLEDDYISLKPATWGYKTDVYEEYKDSGLVDRYAYVEITSDDLSRGVGQENNFTLRNMEAMEYTVKPGYSWTWYQGDFNTPNGAQRFTLEYGSNVQFISITNSSGVVVCNYLLDIYVRHDYHINIYNNIFAENPGKSVRVIEGDRFSANTDKLSAGNFEFDKYVYFNGTTDKYEPFVHSTAITKNWNLYQTYKPIEIEAKLNGGSLDGKLIVTPYTQYFTLLSPKKKNYDFLGWQNDEGKYVTNVQGYSGINYISVSNLPEKLTAVFEPKHMYFTFENDTLTSQPTVPVVTYTDETMNEILEILYVPYNTDCIVPNLTPDIDYAFFKSWKYYYETDGMLSTDLIYYDFDDKITQPLALVPETELTTNVAVPLNTEKIYTACDTYAFFVSTLQRYKLAVSTTGSVTFTVNAYGTESANTYTATSSSPLEIDIDFYRYVQGSAVYNTGVVSFSVTALTGNFTVEIIGATMDTQGKPVSVNDASYGAIGEEYTIEATKLGYTFIGWYNGETLLEDDLSYTFTAPANNINYTAKWIKVTLGRNGDYGTISTLGETYKAGDSVTITATTNAGYTFIGWYNGETKLTDELSYTFEMPSQNVTYTAKWIKVTLGRNGDYGTISTLRETYKAGDSVTITAIAGCIGCSWEGWYNGETRLTDELSYTFEMPSQNVTFTAKWTPVAEMSNFYFTCTETSCVITGIKDNTVTEIIVPDYVTGIEYGTFAGCSSLESITLPFVGESKLDPWDITFGHIFGCLPYDGGIAIQQQYIPGDDYSIQVYYIPASLRSVTITGGNILYGAFRDCDMLTSITIGNDVTSIGDYAFDGVRLANLILGSGVTSIGRYAFSNFGSLTVYYKGTKAQWNGISIDSSNYDLTSATRYYYSETEPTTSGNYWHYDTDGVTPIIWNV